MSLFAFRRPCRPLRYCAPFPSRSFSSGVNIELSHGHRVTTPDDVFMNEADKTIDNFAEASLLDHTVNWLPPRASSFLLKMGLLTS